MTGIEWTTGFTTVEKIVAPIEVLLAVSSLVLYSRIVRRLRDQHPDKWRALGSPTLLSPTAAASGFATICYFLGRGHRELADQGLERMARLWLGTYAVFIAGMFVFGYQILRYGP
jgi:hypothetical protein